MNEFIEQDVTKDAEGQSRLNFGLGVWMPIETAPKQGRILVWNAYFGVYSSEFTIDGTWSGYPLGLTNIGLGKWYCNPTLWQPLPEAPNAEITGSALLRSPS